MFSLRPSARGLEIVDRARQRRGWTKTSTVAWWQSALTSRATLRRFWRQLPIQQDSFIRICEAVGVSNWEEIVDRTTLQEPEEPDMPLQHWGEVPDVCGFYGRTEELTTIEKWIVTENCRLVALLGMGGIGKTALAATLADNIQDKFKYIIWRSLHHAPPVQDVLTDLIRFLFKQETDLPDSLDARVSKLMSYLHQHRCLLVLDNFETVLRSSDLAGYYCEGYEGYGELIRRVGEERHQSCLLLTTREKPREIATLEERTQSVRSLKLKGLDNENAKAIFKAKGFSGDENHWEEIIEIYKGNPLALKIVCTTIQELFNGNVHDFLEEGTAVFGDIFCFLDQQFHRLSDLEKQIMYCLASDREWSSLTQLREELVPPVSKREFMDALASLQRRCLIDKATPKLIETSTQIRGVPFTLQPMVMKYVIKYSAG